MLIARSPSPRALLVASLLVLAACHDKYEMVTVALDSASDVTTEAPTTGASESATASVTVTATASATEGTSGASASASSGESSGVGTTAPAPCDTGPECTSPGDPDGDPGPTTVPYFRGRACVAKAVKPGEAIPIRLEACMHPCLKTNAFAYRHAFRCPGGACEATAVLWFGDVTGSECPSDVFAKFDPALCVYKPAIDIKAGPLAFGGNNFEGDAPIVIPYLSNDQTAEIAAGADTSAEIWSRIDANVQEESRLFTVSVAAGSPSAPAACDDPDLCDCRDVGF
ncbi:MAG: hypothetical protein H6711_19100 [Myxococcales bacterium]|nr:hypothetical protein [Myxococcales bacterium]